MSAVKEWRCIFIPQSRAKSFSGLWLRPRTWQISKRLFTLTWSLLSSPGLEVKRRLIAFDSTSESVGSYESFRRSKLTLDFGYVWQNFMNEALQCITNISRWMAAARCIITTRGNCQECLFAAIILCFSRLQSWITMPFPSRAWTNICLLTTKSWRTGKLIAFCEIVILQFYTTTQCELSSNGNSIHPAKNPCPVGTCLTLWHFVFVVSCVGIINSENFYNS